CKGFPIAALELGYARRRAMVGEPLVGIGNRESLEDGAKVSSVSRIVRGNQCFELLAEAVGGVRVDRHDRSSCLGGNTDSEARKQESDGKCTHDHLLSPPAAEAYHMI